MYFGIKASTHTPPPLPTPSSPEVKTIKIDSVLIKNKESGNVLLVYDHLKFNEKDGYLYYEFLVHPAMASHPNPRRVLIIGGGDGFALKEVLKWNPEKVDVVEENEDLLELGKGKLSKLNGKAFKDRRVSVMERDAKEFLENTTEDNYYQVAIIDTIDPDVSEDASKYYTKEFYELLKQKLSYDGVIVTQAGMCESETFNRIYSTLSLVFKTVRAYCVDVPSMGSWGFVIASNFVDPALSIPKPIDTKAYNESLHYSLFEKQINVKGGEPITENNPIKLRYFFSARLDDDEFIIRKFKVSIGVGKLTSKIITDGYLAITNKRVLLAGYDGVYSFNDIRVGRYFPLSLPTLYLIPFLISSLVYLTSQNIGVRETSLIFMEFYAILYSIILLIAFLGSRSIIRVLGKDVKLYVSNMYKLSEGVSGEEEILNSYAENIKGRDGDDTKVIMLELRNWQEKNKY